MTQICMFDSSRVHALPSVIWLTVNRNSTSNNNTLWAPMPTTHKVTHTIKHAAHARLISSICYNATCRNIVSVVAHFLLRTNTKIVCICPAALKLAHLAPIDLEFWNIICAIAHTHNRCCDERTYSPFSHVLWVGCIAFYALDGAKCARNENE